MRELFDKLTHEFDFILVDSPPVVPVVDAVLLDRLTGGTLLVVASHRTKKRDVAERHQAARHRRAPSWPASP